MYCTQELRCSNVSVAVNLSVVPLNANNMKRILFNGAVCYKAGDLILRFLCDREQNIVTYDRNLGACLFQYLRFLQGHIRNLPQNNL